MKKKTGLFIFLGVVVVAAMIFVFLWNKPPETVDNKTAETVSVEHLVTAFSTNEQQANKDYLNKVIQVTGTISEVSRNQDGFDVILLEASDPTSGVLCTMKTKDAKFEAGKTVTVKGFCNGYTLVVVLSGCVPVNDERAQS